MTISKIGEFGLIDQIARRFRELLPEGWEGIGDDCAVIPWGEEKSLVITTDMLVEGVHFRRNQISSYQLGYKSLAVNLSDIAAMGAKPVASFLSIGLPREVLDEWCAEFLEGYRLLGIPLLGGDTTAAPECIVINVTALGIIENSHLKRRSGAKEGDYIAVTGFLGDSAAGLRLLDINPLPDDKNATHLIKVHQTPRPHTAEGEWLGGQIGVHAMMDLSDGLASDLPHILQASGVSAQISTGQIPVSEALVQITERQGWDALELAIGGGEDYTLLVTLAENEATAIGRAYAQRFGTELSIIGRIVTGETGVIQWDNGLHYQGFHHF